VKHYVHRIHETREVAISEAEVHAMRESSIQEFVGTVRGHIEPITAFYVEHYPELDGEIHQVRFDLDELMQAGERSEESEKAFHKRIYGFMLDLYELRTFLAVSRTGGQKITKEFSLLFEAPEARAE
jgi:hypothetical protein